MELVYHAKTIALLNLAIQTSSTARQALDDVEKSINQQIPASVREWYEKEGAVEILAKYSNADHPVPVYEMGRSLIEARSGSLPNIGKHRYLVFKHENQGVCTWAALLDGSADPPVFLDFDSRFESPVKCSDSFSEYLYSCIWDYSQVLAADSLLVQAQNSPLSEAAVEFLSRNLDKDCVTYGWPGERQYRFLSENQRILIWANRTQADWWLHAETPDALESLIRLVDPIDFVGKALWSNDAQGKLVLGRRNKTTA